MIKCLLTTPRRRSLSSARLVAVTTASEIPPPAVTPLGCTSSSPALIHSKWEPLALSLAAACQRELAVWRDEGDKFAHVASNVAWTFSSPVWLKGCESSWMWSNVQADVHPFGKACHGPSCIFLLRRLLMSVDVVSIYGGRQGKV